MNPLVAATIHDAKNGLNALNTWLGEARLQAPSPALEAAQEVAARINAQLVELLALYRADEHNLRLAIDDHDLSDFCTEVVAEIIAPANASATIVIATPADDAPFAWAFDAYQVKLVLQDALRNALRHARASITLSVAAEPKRGLRFVVQDDGDGYPPGILEGAAGAMNEASSGLGLTFARLIAAHHATPDGRHGQLELSNHHGACFALILP